MVYDYEVYVEHYTTLLISSTGMLVPVRGRSCSSEQIPFIREKFETYESFAKAGLYDIFEESKIIASTHYQAVVFESAVFINMGDSFQMELLPVRAQFDPIRTFLTGDFGQG